MHPPRRPEPHAASHLQACSRLSAPPLREHSAPPPPTHRVIVPRTPHWLLAAGLLLLPAALSHAQGPADGAIHGVIADVSGRPLPHATLTLRNLETLEERTGSGGADGSFLLPHLALGTYALTIGAKDFTRVRYGPLTVILGQTTELRESLRLNDQAGDLELARQTPPESLAASTQTASPQTIFTAGQLALLPSDGGQWQALALAAPGVLPDENADGLLSVHGLSATQNLSLVDGANQNQSFSSVPVGTGADPAIDPDDDSDSAELTSGSANGLARGRHSGASYSFSPAAIREFRISTQSNSAQSYSAQIGHAGGGVLSSVSRSGSAAWHGSGFFVLRSSSLAAKNPLSIATSYAHGVVTSNIVKPHDLRENFGGTIGGPISQAHSLFFFYTFDQQRRGFPAISSPADPNFYQLSAIQRALLANRGVSPRAINTALEYISSLTGPTARRADQTIHFGKLDWSAHPRFDLGLQYNRVRWSSPAGLINAPVVARGRASLGNSAGSIDSVLLRVTTAINTRTLNQLRIQYGRDLQYETAQPSLPQEPGIGPAGSAPEVNIGPNGLLFGTPATVSRKAYPDERRIEFADTFTLVRGRHQIDFGGDLSLVHDRVATLANAAGTFRYDSATARGFAGGLVDFITDYTFNVNTIPNGACPSINAATHLFCFRSFAQSFGEEVVAFSTQEWAGFVDDTWRPHPRLTFHAGLRYEYELLPLPTKPNAKLDAIFGARGATSIFPEDRNNLAPRASIAYQPFGSAGVTLRLGYGVFFGRLPGATIRSALADTAQPSSTTHVHITPAAVTACPQTPFQGFGYPCSFLAQPTGAIASTSSAVVFDRRFRLPVVQQGSLSFETSISRRLTLSAGYLIDIDRQLPSSTDLNIAPSTQSALFRLRGGAGTLGVRDGESFVLPLYTARLTPSFGPVTAILSHANATYHALILEANSRPLASLHLRANYTWAKAIDYGQSASATPRQDSQLDPFTNRYDKGLSSLDYPWALHLNATWKPQIESGSAWVRHIANGWEAAPLLAARSGRPYSYDLFGGPRLAGGHASLNGSGGALYLPTVGRNTLRLPPTINVNLRIGREFQAGSRLHLTASAETFNILNHRNIASVNQRAYVVGAEVAGVTPLIFQDAATIAAEGLNTQPFGTPTSANTSLAHERQIQLTLRVQF